MFGGHASAAIFFSLTKAFAVTFYPKIINHPKYPRIFSYRNLHNACETIQSIEAYFVFVCVLQNKWLSVYMCVHV